MQWIIDNKEWIFSGIGVTLAVFFFNFVIKKKKNPINNIIKNTSESQNTNKISNKIIINQNEQIKQDIKKLDLTKDSLQVLFVDDEKFKIVENLKKAGWINTKTIKDVTNLDCIDVKNAHVIFVDINGVGEVLFPTDKGLGLAEALKKKYLDKYIVIYSAQEQGDRFHKALKVVDFTLPKNAEPYEFINILENRIQK